MSLHNLQMRARELLELLDSAEVTSNGDLEPHKFDAMYDYALRMLRRELEPADSEWTEQDYRAHEADFANKERRTA